MKSNWGGSLIVVNEYYEHYSAILKSENFPRYISVTKQNTQFGSYLISLFTAKTPVKSLC